MRCLLLLSLSLSVIGAELEPYEASDVSGHLVSKGFRLRVGEDYVRAGHWVYFAEGHKIAEGNFDFDTKEGEWSTWTVPPATPVKMVETFKHGHPIHRRNFYPASETLIEAEGDVDPTTETPDGAWTEYYRNGSPKAAETYARGTLKAWIMYAPGGTLLAKSSATGNAANEWQAAYPKLEEAAKLDAAP